MFATDKQACKSNFKMNKIDSFKRNQKRNDKISTQFTKLVAQNLRNYE
jgi:hypothetical protein